MLRISRIGGTRSPRRLLGLLLSSYGWLFMLAILVALFANLNANFLTFDNLKSMLEQNAALAIISVGMTFAIISRNIDLAPGSLIALAGVITGLVFTSTGNIALALLAGLATTLAVDLFNGFLIARIGINPLIITLAAWIWVRGLAITLTKANSIIIDSPFVYFVNLASFLGISPPVAAIIIAFLVGWFVLHKTRLGRYTYALGGDEQATRQAGVNTVFHRILLFGLLGLFAALASAVNIGLIGAADPNTANGLELDAIVAVIIGGNPFQGGEGRLRKTLYGVLFIAVLDNGLSLLGMRDAYFYTYKGIAILLALTFEVASRQLLKDTEAPGAEAEIDG